MRDVHGLSFTSIGLVSALPQVFLLFVTMGAALLADRLRTRKRRPLSSRTVRRALTALGLGLNALFFVALTPLRESATTAAVMFVVAYSLLGFPVGGGYGVNHLDIAPRAAGVIVGISNTWGSVAGACAPVVMGWLTPFPLGRSRDSFDDGSAGKRPDAWFRSFGRGHQLTGGWGRSWGSASRLGGDNVGGVGACVHLRGRDGRGWDRGLPDARAGAAAACPRPEPRKALTAAIVCG